jgi:hypothetical protein
MSEDNKPLPSKKRGDNHRRPRRPILWLQIKGSPKKEKKSKKEMLEIS